jgi:hypothetical protein
MATIKGIELRKAYMDFVLNNGPFEYFITLTFKHSQREEDCNQQINFLLSLMNRKLFGRKYSNQIMEGFAFAEPHRFFRNSVHYHLVIKGDEVFHLEGKKTIQEHFRGCLSKVKCYRTGLAAFDERGCDFKKVYDQGGLIKYLTKSFEVRDDATFIQPLSSSGIDRVFW